MSYKNAGVDIDLANETKAEIKQALPRLITNPQPLGAFAILVDISFPEYESPVLVLRRLRSRAQSNSSLSNTTGTSRYAST